MSHSTYYAGTVTGSVGNGVTNNFLNGKLVSSFSNNHNNRNSGNTNTTIFPSGSTIVHSSFSGNGVKCSSVTMTGGIVRIDGETYHNVYEVTIKCREEKDGQAATLSTVSKTDLVSPLRIEITGDVDEINATNGDVSVSGKSGQIKASYGKVKVKGSVTGGVASTYGEVTIGGDLQGNVTTTYGSIKCKGCNKCGGAGGNHKKNKIAKPKYVNK